MLAGLRERYRRRQAVLESFIARMPARERWQLAAAVFCCFAPFGLLTGVPSLSSPSPLRIAVLTLQSGLIAVVYGASGVSRHRRVLLPLTAILHVSTSLAMGRWLPAMPYPTSLGAAAVTAVRRNLTGVVMTAVVLTTLAYLLFVRVFQTVGARYARVDAEIRLATEIHAALVPVVEGRLAQPAIAWRGVSRPSGEVGGDLVDVEATPNRWLACVADVSGHGVHAGVLMGMFKAALRATDAPDAATMVTHINRTLGPLTQPQMFITVALLRRLDARSFEYVLAGHPPLLHVSARTGEAVWHGDSQLALAMFDEVPYRATTIATEPGDLLVVVTDGLTEVFDGAGREFGRDGVREAVTSLVVSAPLADIEAQLFTRARQHGLQLDDQTVLLIRV